MKTSSSTTTLCILLLTALLSFSNAKKSHLRPTKKYLRCNVNSFACGNAGDDRVNLCHYNGKEFTTRCVQSRSSIVEHWHAQDYCGQCVETHRHAFASRTELQKAVDHYLDDPTSHKRLSAKYGYPMGQWDVGRVTDFSHLFAKRIEFNEDIALWNTTSATSLDYMFEHAHSFEGDISRWDVSNVESMERTFFGAGKFNADIRGWKTTSLTNLMGTFWRATSFNQPLNSWDTSKVEIMSRCFSQATSFNQPLDQWDTSHVLDASYMFQQAVAFSQDLTNWQVHGVQTFEGMFSKVPHYQIPQVQKEVTRTWKMSKGAVVNHMFTAPRDKSLRAQKFENMQLDLQALLRATSQNNETQTDGKPGNDNGEVLSREILCHGGVCM